MSYRTVAATLVALSALSAVVLAIAVNIATGGTPPPLGYQLPTLGRSS